MSDLPTPEELARLTEAASGGAGAPTLPKGRVLGIDYGTVRIGVAVSDYLGVVATIVEVIHDRPGPTSAARIAELARDRDAVGLVFGIPINMDGSRHAAHDHVEAFANLCGEATGLPVDYVDERMTTLLAERHLRDAGIHRKARKQRVDKVAAVILLQSWLDSRPS